MIQENRFTSFTTYGMPMRFELHDTLTNKMHKVVDFWDCYEDDIIDKKYLIPSQAIGITDSSDPKQWLHLGDLIEVRVPLKEPLVFIGLIVWHHFSVRIASRDGCVISYMSLNYIMEKGYKIKKLGSRYTKEGKEILKKAGLLENKVQ